jgi:UDP-glucuronate decarboxylase
MMAQRPEKQLFTNTPQDIVEEVQKEAGVPSKRVSIIHKDMPTDDPQRRRPDTTRAKETLDWQPRFAVRQGVREMTLYYHQKIQQGLL